MSVRVAVIDSGIGADDRLGHGSKVASIIRQHAPDADLVSVRIFEDRLACRIETLVAAIQWAARNGIDIANLSVGTPNPSHAESLLQAVQVARTAGVAIVAACGWLPGNLPGVIAVDEDRTCPFGTWRTRMSQGRRVVACSSELRGVSFAVAAATGHLARELAALRSLGRPEPADLLDLLVTQAEV